MRTGHADLEQDAARSISVCGQVTRMREHVMQALDFVPTTTHTVGVTMK